MPENFTPQQNLIEKPQAHTSMEDLAHQASSNGSDAQHLREIYGQLLDTHPIDSPETMEQITPLSEDDRAKLDQAVGVILANRTPFARDNIIRQTGIDTILPYGKRSFEYLRQKLLVDPDGEDQFAGLVNLMAQPDDVPYILHMLGDQNFGRLGLARNILAQALPRLFYSLRGDPGKLVPLSTALVDLLSQDPRGTRHFVGNYCRTALDLAGADIAQEYLRNFEEGIDYTPAEEVLEEPEKHFTVWPFSPSAFREQPNIGQASRADTLTRDEWKHALKRLIRRSVIDQNLDSSETLGELKDRVRQFESSIDVNGLIESLVDEEFTVSPQIASIATAIFEMTREVSETQTRRFPNVRAIIVVGSAVHGGARMKEATQSTDPPDLDWGIVEEDMTDNQRSGLIARVRSILPDLSKKAGLKNAIKSCSFTEPTKLHVPMLETPEQFIALVSGNEAYRFLPLADLYFYPSFPAQINEHNREMVRRALQQLDDVNPQASVWIRSKLLGNLIERHALQEKHINSAPRIKDEQLRQKVIIASRRHMADPQKSMLEPEKAA